LPARRVAVARNRECDHPSGGAAAESAVHLLTLGFGILIVNALMLRLVGAIMPCLHVESFGRAFWGALLISIVSWLLSAFFRDSQGKVQILTHHAQMKEVRGRVIE